MNLISYMLFCKMEKKTSVKFYNFVNTNTVFVFVVNTNTVLGTVPGK